MSEWRERDAQNWLIFSVVVYGSNIAWMVCEVPKLRGKNTLNEEKLCLR
jgi:hypothetical protein